MHVYDDAFHPLCPSCGGTLEWLGSEEACLGEAELHRAHLYVCPAGCRGRTPDGTFEFVECPLCGSHDTWSGPQSDGAEELECNACGAVVTVQLHAATATP